MGKIDSLLDARFSSKSKTTKMADLAERSSSGALSSFSGVFGQMELSEPEKANLQELLTKYNDADRDIIGDLRSLIHITSEIKAINNQAALLHGERIKQAQTLLKTYREGAFTNWLLTTYGNRQTPYNLLQYYEFYQAIPKELQQIVENMPRQAIYTLASREGDLESKLAIVRAFAGQSKKELLTLIRERFPLSAHDRRKPDWGDMLKHTLEELVNETARAKPELNEAQRGTLKGLIQELHELIS
jgi:hypothetical protein